VTGTQHDLDDSYEDIATETLYTVEVIARGTDLAVLVDSAHKLAGRYDGTITGSVGVRLWNAMSHFDNFVVAPMIPLTTSIDTFSEQPHAVTAISHTTGIGRYEYDPNGNMTLRVELSGTQPITCYQEYDIENGRTSFAWAVSAAPKLHEAQA
jgi:hypothetical protein